MNKKKIIIISVVIVVILAIVAGIAFWLGKPYLRIKEVKDFLQDGNYTFECEYEIEEGLPELLNVIKEGKLIGEKQKKVVYSKVIVDEKTYLEVYFDHGNAVFNIKYLLDKALDIIDDKIDFPLGFLSFLMKDVYISTDQVKELLGDNAISSDAISISKDVDVKQIKAPKEAKEVYQHDAYFFMLEDEENGLNAIVGVPKDKKIMEYYIHVEKDSFKATALLQCEKAKKKTIDVPKDTIPNQSIEYLKSVIDKVKGFISPSSTDENKDENQSETTDEKKEDVIDTL